MIESFLEGIYTKSNKIFLYLMFCVFFLGFCINFYFFKEFSANSNKQSVFFLASNIVYSEDFEETNSPWTLEYVNDPYLYAFTSELPKYIVKDEIFVKYFWYYTEEIVSIPSQIVDCASIHYENGFWWLSSGYNDRVYKCYENWTCTGDSYYVGAQEIYPSSIHYFNNSWWMTGPNSDAVHKYYDNWTYTSISISVSIEGSPSDIFYQNGNWWMLSESKQRVYMYYDNWSYTGVNFYLGNEDIWPRSLDYWDGYWWVMGEKNDHIYKYSNNWTYTGESISVFDIDYWTSDIHISDGVLWYQGAYADSIYKFNYEDLYQIPKRNVKDDCIFVQTDISEVIALLSPSYKDLALKENSRVEVKFNTTSRNRINLRFLDDMNIMENIEISPPENSIFITQIVEKTISEELTFDQLQIDGNFNPSDNLIIDFIKIYGVKTEGNNDFLNLFIPVLIILGLVVVVVVFPGGYYLLKKRKFPIITDEKVKRGKTVKVKVNIPEGINKFVGFSILGGLLSIMISLLISIIYPELYIFGSIFMVILQIAMFCGGLLTIAGAIFSYKNLKLGRTLVLIGAILGGGNIITLSSLRYLKD